MKREAGARTSTRSITFILGGTCSSGWEYRGEHCIQAAIYQTIVIGGTRGWPQLASFPGPTQLSIACSTVQVTESWVGPGNEARPQLVELKLVVPVEIRLAGDTSPVDHSTSNIVRQIRFSVSGGIGNPQGFQGKDLCRSGGKAPSPDTARPGRCHMQ